MGTILAAATFVLHTKGLSNDKCSQPDIAGLGPPQLLHTDCCRRDCPLPVTSFHCLLSSLCPYRRPGSDGRYAFSTTGGDAKKSPHFVARQILAHCAPKPKRAGALDPLFRRTRGASRDRETKGAGHCMRLHASGLLRSRFCADRLHRHL